MRKIRFATVWLDGCSGCHMSFLDMDERILEVAPRIELVYSPLVDHKEFPAGVDVTLVEGAVASEEDLHRIQLVRAHTRILVALGDCSITTNVPGMRNPFGVRACMERAFVENAETNRQPPTKVVPKLLDRVRPVHEVVKVDVFLPGCPPSADTVFAAVAALLDGRPLDLSQAHFG